MSCFLTIHQRIPVGEDVAEFDNCVWVNVETPGWRHEIGKGDRVFVYEAAKLIHAGYVEVNRHLKKAQDPRQGLVSCFVVTSSLIPEGPDTYEGNSYLRGSCDTPRDPRLEAHNPKVVDSHPTQLMLPVSKPGRPQQAAFLIARRQNGYRTRRSRLHFLRW